jgi:type II secretory pathway pseudopilin PulG
MKGRSPRQLSGMTLVETLAAVGAVIALAGVASPLLVSAKEHAAASAEMSELHQLAVAQSIYTADTLGIPTSTLPLVHGGYISSDLCVSPLDNSVRGIANEFDSDVAQHSAIYSSFVVPYRSSYIGLRELGFPYTWLDKYVKGKDGAGWLVSLTGTNHQDADHWNSWFTGTYRRVCLDGSVQVKKHEPVSISTLSGSTPVEHDFLLFVDGTNEWKRKFISGQH